MSNFKKYFTKTILNPLFYVAIGFVVIMGYQGITETNGRDTYTTGSIVSYSRCGVTGICVSFKFDVKGRTYKGKGTPRKGLKKCQETKWCIDKKYLVKYENKNPKNSVIFLDLPINPQEEPKSTY
jgi:hypothetical protein